MTRLYLTQKDFIEKNNKTKSPDQLSSYAERIKCLKKILEDAKNALLTCTDEHEKMIHLEDIKEVERDLKGYDLSCENQTVAEFNALQEIEFRKRISEPASENVFIVELREDHPERMELFNRLLNIINTGYFLAKSELPSEEVYYFNIMNETDLALALINYNPETERFYFNPKKILNPHPLRDGQSLIGFRFNGENVEKFHDSIIEEEKKALYPVLKSHDEAEKLFGKDYEYEIYFLESEINSEEYNTLNKKNVSHIDKDSFITIFMFINIINLDTILEKSPQYLGFDPLYDKAIDITDIHGNLLNTIDIPEYLLYSIASISDDQEIGLSIKNNRTINFIIRDKRPIFASGKEDLAVAIPRNLIEMREYGKELKFPYHYNLPGVGIVSPKITDGKVRLEKTSRNQLTLDLAKVIDWRKNSDVFSPKEYPPAKQMDIMVDMDNAPELPTCRRVIPIPYINPKGMCHYTEGYDEENEILQFHVEELNFKKINNFPSREEINKAKVILHEPFSEFPFESECDYTNFISYILTPFLSTVIPNALKPIFCNKAADVGNGKTLISECGARIFSKNYLMSNITGDEAEVDRKLLSLLSCFPDTIIFDNVNKIDSPSLALNMTSRHYSGRQIGTSKTLIIPNNATIVITGNNPEFSKELARRTVFVNLNARMENSEYGRKFKIKNLVSYIEKHRADLIWACLTIIKAWFSAGKPADKEFKPMGSFEEWSTTMYGILANAGYKSFLENRGSVREIVDVETLSWKILASLIYSKFGSQRLTTDDIYNIAKGIEGIDIQGKNPIDQKKSMGKQLAKNLNKVYGEYMLIDAGISHKSRTWKIQPVKPCGFGDNDENSIHKKNPLY